MDVSAMLRRGTCVASCSGRCLESSRTTIARPTLLHPRLTQPSFTATNARLRRPCSSPILAASSSSSSPKSSMTLHQRLRALQFAIKDKRQAFLNSPPITSLLAAITAIKLKLKPLFDLIAAIQLRWQDVIDEYNQFIAEETKRRWTWSKRFNQELELWNKVPAYVYFLACTLLYEVMVPVSGLLAIGLPLYYAWVIWDKWWVSPVFVGMLVMVPLKFVPWCNPCWIWPGLI